MQSFHNDFTDAQHASLKELLSTSDFAVMERRGGGNSRVYRIGGVG